MAYNFSANQFENAFNPHRLRNYEVPKWYPKHPVTLCKSTRIIGNDRGHQLPFAKRPECNPWGYHLNTWQLPLRITPKVAEELTKPHPTRLAAWQRHVEAAAARCGKLVDPKTKTKDKNGGICDGGPFAPQPPPKDMVYVYCSCTDSAFCDVFTMKAPPLKGSDKPGQVEDNVQEETKKSPREPPCPVHGVRRKPKNNNTKKANEQNNNI